MEIISLKYAVLSIASAAIYYMLNQRFRTVFLAFLSCCFVASFSYILLAYIVLYAIINYSLGITIPSSKYKKILFKAGLALNLIQLVLLKYASFAVDPVLHIFNDTLHVSKISEIIIPVGISYFTLQGIGYLINIKNGWEKPEKNFVDFILYITFFPKFLSGPIERSNHFLPQIKKSHLFNEQQVSEGLRIALFGFFKKIAIANQLAPFITETYGNLSNADGSTLLILFLFQPLYLYFDFSGYTDIAIGFSKIFGIDILPNFNRPFLAENVTTFWKRFHVSLSSWFNDYIFRQISFKYRRWGVYASSYAVLITFLLFGIWHGAGWNFMALGLLQALAINYEFFTKRWRLRLFSKLPDYAIKWFGRIITYLFYCVSLTFFFSPDLKSTFSFLKNMLVINGSLQSVILMQIPISTYLFALALIVMELIANDYTKTNIRLEALWTGRNVKNRIFRWIIYSSVLAVLFVLGNNVQQFIYVQF
jgi:D-alanyl-lipoteichoic acid acyltransferase DltB (MBOAT superfamily)